MGLKQLQKDFLNELEQIYSRSEALHIFSLVIENITGKDRRQQNNEEIILTDSAAQQFHDIKKRLLTQEPLQYILNEAWFYDIPFYVDGNVLIPRPETEELVDWIIKDNHSNSKITILDIGTGSGCIPVILKRKLPNATVYSCDISLEALTVAKKNAEKYCCHINFLQLDILNKTNWKGLPKADIIVSNPPYVPETDKQTMCNNVLKFEPHTALFVKDNDPLLFYKTIIEAGQSLLTTNGAVYVELYENLGTATRDLFEAANYTTILKTDMQSKYRMLKASLNG